MHISKENCISQKSAKLQVKIQKKITLLEVTVIYISVPKNIALLKFPQHKVSDKVEPLQGKIAYFKSA